MPRGESQFWISIKGEITMWEEAFYTLYKLQRKTGTPQNTHTDACCSWGPSPQPSCCANQHCASHIATVQARASLCLTRSTDSGCILERGVIGWCRWALLKSLLLLLGYISFDVPDVVIGRIATEVPAPWSCITSCTLIRNIISQPCSIRNM